MKCPNCGAYMRESELYCLKCGGEIHMVPDFEPEIEDAYQLTIENITNDIWRKDGKEESGRSQMWSVNQKMDAALKTTHIGEGSESNKKRKAVWFAGIGSVVCALLFAGVRLYFYNSIDYQTARARNSMAEKRYDQAVKYYSRALELDEDNVDLKVELSQVYFEENNKIEYEYLLREIVKEENATQEQIESAYGKLIAIYRSRGDFQTINDFLLASENEEVIATYQMYVAKEPEFSVKEGFYTSIQPLKLTAFGNGKIYYTMDGSVPDENSSQYTTPILLENGDYDIKAYYVSENGIYSDVVEKK